MASKTSVPKGTRDFTPEQMVRRDYIFSVIQQVFRKYGYLPIETPAMEHLDTLLGKYGDEGDKLLFKVLNSGDYLKGASAEALEGKNSQALTSDIAGRGLRYDLTVPFARFVVQHRNALQFPFKRYQIQPVWRADKPQKGRYREFYQCDVDVIGSKSLLNELELIKINDEVFSALGIAVTMQVNNRKILAGMAELIGQPEKMTDITVAIDKLEKIGQEGVHAELLAKGIPATAIEKLQPILNIQGSTAEKLQALQMTIGETESGGQGIAEIREVFDYLDTVELNNPVALNIALARGLNYYTGAIFEVKARDASIGSICGGGRYDDLTGIFGLKDVSGVGISFGADRIYDVLVQLDKFPESVTQATQVLFVNFGGHETRYVLPLLDKLHDAGVCAELYPDSVKMKKQMQYANKKAVPYVVLAGEEEIKSQTVTLKNMETGEQTKLSHEGLLKAVKGEEL